MIHKRYKNDGIPIIPLNKTQFKTLKEIKQKLKEGIYEFEKVPCCICGSKNFKLLSEKDRYGLYNPVVICRNCGLIQINPRMNQQAYNNYYQYHYRKLIRGLKKPSERHFQREYQRGLKIYNYLDKNNIVNKLTRNSLIFEVGCGSGGVLGAFRDKGYDVKGCDLDKNFVKFGREKKNLDLLFSPLAEVSFQRKIDLIIYSHVLEHILFPVKELKLVKKALNESGYIYIEVPGLSKIQNSYGSNFLRFIQLNHIYYFTPSTLNNLLGIAGFKIISGDHEIRSVYKCIKNYSNEYKLLNNYEESLNYLNLIENQRVKYLIKKYMKNPFELFKNKFKSFSKTFISFRNLIKLLINKIIEKIAKFKS